MRIVLADTTASGTETARLLLDDVPSPVRLRDLISVMDAASALAVWCDQPGDAGLLDAIEALAATVDAHSDMLARDRARIRKRLLSLRPEVSADAALDVTMIRPDDGWSQAALDRAARWQGDHGHANLLLRHLMVAAGSKPSRRWMERAATLLSR